MSLFNQNTIRANKNSIGNLSNQAEILHEAFHTGSVEVAPQLTRTILSKSVQISTNYLWEQK